MDFAFDRVKLNQVKLTNEILKGYSTIKKQLGHWWDSLKAAIMPNLVCGQKVEIGAKGQGNF